MENPFLLSSKAFSTLVFLRQVAPRLASDFDGLGIVLYDTLEGLPHLQLQVDSEQDFDLPAKGLAPIYDVLARTARRSSPWHDGFYFVHAASQSLTHLCQYVAPPLPGASEARPHASGARHMTALLASKVAGIVAIGLLTQARVASVYEAGQLISSETL